MLPMQGNSGYGYRLSTFARSDPNGRSLGKANEELYTCARANYCEISPNNQKAYMIYDSHIAEVVKIIRGGLE